jgi:hypothetical protein
LYPDYEGLVKGPGNKKPFYLKKREMDESWDRNGTLVTAAIVQ